MAKIPDRYRLIEELGRGGMGVVYKVEDKMLERVVALKRVLKKDNKTLIERFLAEAKSIAALNNSNIIQIYDIGQDTEGLYITTEFVAGTDLEKLLKNKGPLSPKVVLKLIVPICRALQQAHESNVIHRDIKPANILLTEKGVPKIADFGLARRESMKKKELTGMIMGTRAYASPEQFMDAKHVDHRTDIYSVGALCYEMLTGKNPQFFREMDVPQPFRQIITKAMAREPGQRYQTLTEMLAALSHIAAPRSRPTAQQAQRPPATMVRPPSVLAEDTAEMVLIPEGPSRFGQEGRVSQLPAFYTDKYPVTNEQFARFKPTHLYPPQEANHPATKMTWLEANAYARKHGKRLPTEAEWEKAARGEDGRRFPWGNQFSGDKCNTLEAAIDGTTPVDAYPEGQSAYGVMDMAGNVWEWTGTYLDRRETARVLKGGAFNGEAKFALCYARFAYPERGLLPTAGFRCVKNV